ncbi:MAG: hypothetical protein CL840_14745 [Crocinitomicaceae bacterium]|nr:hypothetical protein [Crocinitomicaceae bacterium]|tara:strand:- start:33529 stop:34083 length:555 start_codon:yes stop_codon:yes gene_type:complete
MSKSLAEQYYLKALDNYPFELENAMESLEYALSYDSAHAGALHTMGCLYMDVLSDYKTALKYLKSAFTSNPKSLKIGLDLLFCLTNTRHFEEAQKLVTYLHSFNREGVGGIYTAEGLLHEYMHDYSKSIAKYKLAKKESYNNSYNSWLDGELARVKKKLKKSKTKKKKKESKKLYSEVTYYFSR